MTTATAIITATDAPTAMPAISADETDDVDPTTVPLLGLADDVDDGLLPAPPPPPPAAEGDACGVVLSDGDTATEAMGDEGAGEADDPVEVDLELVYVT